MQLGIFAKTFSRPSLTAVLDAVVAEGVRCVQFNMSCAGLESLPSRIDPELCRVIREETQLRDLSMAAVSGTFNMIHPSRELRRDGLQRLCTLVAAAPQMGTSVITLCTGTRDPDNMWRRHPDNDCADAWRDLTESLWLALETTDATKVTLAFEPEQANVIDSAVKARRLLDEVRSPRLKVVLDCANLIGPDDAPRMRAIVQEAVDLLAGDIALVHAKELGNRDQPGPLMLGTGRLDFDDILNSLSQAGVCGPLIMHGMDESQAAGSAAFLRKRLGKSEFFAGAR